MLSCWSTGAFGNSAPALGYLILTPVNSTFAITSRTYATDPAHPEFGTYGSGTPTLAVSAALTNGSLRAIGSLEDTTSAAVINAITDAIGKNNLEMPATPDRVWRTIHAA